MLFLKRSITVKAALLLAGGLAVSALLSQFFFEEPLMLAFLAAFAVFSFIVIYAGVHRPLQSVFTQMKLLLSGRPFKKIFTTRIDEFGVLANFFNEVTKSMARISGDMEEGRRMAKELSVGSDIQRKILPKEMPAIQGLTMFGNTRPASEVGGDSYDVIQTPDNTFMYVGDVTGHGLPAGLIMVMVNTLIRTYAELQPNSYDVIVNTNRILKSRIEPRRFMTCVLLRWSHQEQKLYYTGAGHEHILVFSQKTKICEVRQTGGIALGMVPDVSKIVKEETIPLEFGDVVVLYSDGVVEAKNMQGQMFTVDRLKNAVEQYAPRSTPQDIFTSIFKDFAAFVGEQTQADDITLIALQKT